MIQSMDDLVAKLTASTPQFCRADWMKLTAANYAINRWYDLSPLQGFPPGHGIANVLGEWLQNGTFDGGSNFWTLSDVGWIWSANTMTKVNAGAAGALIGSMQKTVVAGYIYRVTWTISAISGGNLTIKLGNTPGAAQTTTGTKVEYIPASNTDPFRITPSVSTMTATIDNVSVIAVHQAASQYGSQLLPMDDSMAAAIYHGGNVSTATKHVLNAGAFSANMVPGMLLLVDMLGIYAGINLATYALQTLDNGFALPRYATGVGVRAYFVCTVANGATPQNFSISYTNSGSTPGKAMPVTVASTASSVVGHILHAGTNPNNYGPFLPMAAGDLGVKSVQSVTMSASAGSGEAALVLCKPLLCLPMGTAGVAGERDLLNQIPSLPRVYDGACLQWLFFAGAAFTAPVQMNGYIDMGWS